MQPNSVAHLILLVFALVCALLAAFWNPQPNPPRVQLGWLALAFFIASFLPSPF